MENIQKNLLSMRFLNCENQCASSHFISSLFSEKSQNVKSKNEWKEKSKRNGIYLRIPEFGNLLLQTTVHHGSGQLT